MCDKSDKCDKHHKFDKCNKGDASDKSDMSDKRDIRDKCENHYLTNNRFIIWKCLQIELDVHPSVVEDIQKQNEMCTVLFVNVACSIIQIVKFSTKVNLAFNNQMYSPKHHIYQKMSQS